MVRKRDQDAVGGWDWGDDPGRCSAGAPSMRSRPVRGDCGAGACCLRRLAVPVSGRSEGNGLP